MKLNFKLGEPTVNGRIYPKETKEAFEKVKYVSMRTEHPENSVVDLTKIFGTADTKVEEDGSINVKITPVAWNRLANIMESALNFEYYDLTSCGVGEIEGNVVKNYRPSYFYFIPKVKE
jgi:uncharacterized Ntn-hydrolase superfamily protein